MLDLIDKNTILIITRNYFVYEIPLIYFSAINRNLYLVNRPKTLAEKYPILYNDDYFQMIKNQIKNAFVINLNETYWLCFLPMDQSLIGINFNLKTEQLLTGFINDNLKITHQTLIYQWPRNYYRFYCIQNMVKVSFIQSHIFQWSMFDHINPDDWFICRSAYSYLNPRKEIYLSQFGCATKEDFTCIYNGILISGYFYLFTMKRIYIISQKLLDEGTFKRTYELTQSYENFFICTEPNRINDGKFIFGNFFNSIQFNLKFILLFVDLNFWISLILIIIIISLVLFVLIFIIGPLDLESKYRFKKVHLTMHLQK